MKAFLSHSSANKDYVETVAKELGRQFCVFDKFTFASGREFKDSIDKGLDDSNIFVLFASPDSVASFWVEFEVGEAFFRVIQKRIGRILVLLMGDAAMLEKLPEWLRRAKAVVVKSPRHAAKEIRLHLNDLLRNKKHPLFIGRADELAEAEEMLLSQVDGKLPRFLIFVGLPQIGRRSVARRVGQDVLAMTSTTEIVIENGDDLRDLAFKLACEIEPYSGPDSLAHIQRGIEKLADDEAITRAHDCLRALIESGSLPILVDGGGLVNDNGHFAECFHPFFRRVNDDANTYLFFIASQKPVSTGPLHTYCIRVPALPEKEVRKLLIGLLSRDGIAIGPSDVARFINHIGGYPPSCYFASQLIKTYGVPAILANTAELVDFRVAAFVTYITKHALTEVENRLLRLFANFSPLPLSVAGEFCGLDPEAASTAIIRLIDLSMLSPDKAGCYQISEPLRDAVFRRAEIFTRSQKQKLAKLINGWLSENLEEGISLSFSRVIFRVASQAGDSALEKRVVHLTADNFRLAEQAYNQQDYESAVDGFRKVLELRPGHSRATVLLVRALAQLEEWSECESLCSTLERDKSPVRTTEFLRGFVERKRARIPSAIRHFELARKAGRNDVAILRELAWCHFISNDTGKAEICLNEAFELQPDNVYLIDMAVRVALGQGNLVEAKRQLDRLRVLDTDAFYWHRMATLQVKSGNIAAAVEAGLQAISGVDRPRFEALAHLTYCELRLKKNNEARCHLAELDRFFPKLRKNITFALQCHLELAAGNFDEVLRRIDRDTANTNRFFLALRHGAIRRLIAHPGTSEARRNEFRNELDAAGVDAEAEPMFEDLPR